MAEKQKIENGKLPPQNRFLNRELSWIAFNERVLEEAENPYNPLLERVNFLSISASNIDEFTMVRVAGLMDQLVYGVSTTSIDGKSTEQQLEAIRDAMKKLAKRQQQCWQALREELQHADIILINKSEQLSAKDRQWLHEYFMDNFFPVLTPIAVDPAHPFPFIPNLGIAQLFKIRQLANNKSRIAVVLFPPKICRFVLLPRDKKGCYRLIRAENIIELFLDNLFPGFNLEQSAVIRVIRDSELDISEKAKDLVTGFEQAIKRRRRGRVVRLETSADIPQPLLDKVMQNLQVQPEDVLKLHNIVGLSQVGELTQLPCPHLKYKPFNVRFPERIEDFDGDCFAAIAAKDIVVHHPYESFDVVVQFIKQAARDKDVLSIKGTLYRTSDDSPIIAALIEAAENGKSVTAVVELKARFDEEANIRWARDLERAGVQVVYGFVKLKTHAKVTLVTRRTGNKLKSYVHYGTGNYHPSTAKIYTDLSFFTCDETLCRDAAHFFNFVTGYAQPRDIRKLIMAPKTLRSELMELIANEIEHAKSGRPANIWAKMNALLDPHIIDALYEASQAGVVINLVVRGICSLRPGVSGLSDNITVKSIVGRFLEHARIYAFGNGYKLPSNKAKLYISSADWMPRNLDHRVELMIPIENPTVHAQILGQIMVANLKDEKQSWMMQADGSYIRMPYDEHGFCAHDYFMNNPSLSGRGKALGKAKSASAGIYKLK